MASPATVDFTRLQAAPVATSQKGAKTSQLTIDGAAIYWSPGWMEVAFEPKAYDGSDASRVSLCLRVCPTSVILKQLAQLDDAVLTLAHANAQAFFGKDLTPEQIQDRYVSPVKTSTSHPPLFRPKINLTGQKPCRFWQANSRAEAPVTWAGAQVTPRLCVKALWFNAGQFGCLCEVHDAIVHESSDAEMCPF
jgi:hypothetical protein